MVPALAVAVALLAASVMFIPSMWSYTSFESTPRPKGTLVNPNQPPNADTDGIKREDVRFASTNGAMCHGWLYTPIRDVSLQNEADGLFPAVVMAHGIGATKDMGLDDFAKHFASRGMVVLVFDYLHFGLSDGLPRHKIDPLQHVRDYESAVKYAKRLSNVDSNRMALWGTSYAGGHVLVAASHDIPGIKAVVSQMPFLGPMSSESKLDELKKRGFVTVAKSLLGAVSSKLRGMSGLPLFYSRMYGYLDDGLPLALNYWELIGATEEEFLAKHAEARTNDWRNAVLTESLLDMIKYKPIEHVDNIDMSKLKVMVVQAKRDVICPNDRMDYVIDKLNCQRAVEDTTHFSMYRGKAFESVSVKQSDFLRGNLQPPEPQLKVLDS